MHRVPLLAANIIPGRRQCLPSGLTSPRRMIYKSNPTTIICLLAVINPWTLVLTAYSFPRQR